jgi:HlyD family secretion protein
MQLVLNVGALEGKPFTATLEYIAPKGVTDQGTIKFTIRAAVQLSKELFLRSNYSANADIVLDRRDDVLAINEGDLIIEGHQDLRRGGDGAAAVREARDQDRPVRRHPHRSGPTGLKLEEKIKHR